MRIAPSNRIGVPRLDYGYDETLHSFDKAAGKLGIEQIDPIRTPSVSKTSAA